MLSTVEKVLFLMRAPATADANTDALARLAALAEEVEIAPGGRLFTAGEPPSALNLILDGAVRVDEDDEGAARIVGPGDAPGALALFSASPHAATATCVVTTRALRLSREDLYDLLDEDGELARALFTGLVRVAAAHDPSLLEA